MVSSVSPSLDPKRRSSERAVQDTTGYRRDELTRVLVSVALALLVAGGLIFARPSAAFSAPASTVDTGAIAAKKAQQEANERELAGLRRTMAARIAEYVKVSKQLERTRSEVDKLDAQIAQQDVELEQAKLSFEQRAVEIYRNRRVGMLEILMTAGSLQELMSRANFLVMVGQRDARTITDFRKVQSETLWLQDSLGNRMDYLTQLQTQADDQRSQIETDLALGEARVTALGTDIARLMRGDAAVISGGTPSGVFSPDTVISETTFRDSKSMSVTDIQKFLERQPGTLKSLRARDHNGNVRYASEMIAEAAVAFRVNPKVIIVKLQKEQSLLGDASPTQKQLDWATGCGRGDSYTSYQFQGFGNQIWWGAQKLDKNSKPWRPGIKMTIDGSAVYPTNAATYSLYKYTPHIRGTTSFWLLYWRYFGDPLV